MATKQQSTRRDPQSVDTDGSIPGSGEFLGLDNEAFHYVLASPVGEYGGTAVDYANKGYEPVERGGDIKTRSEALFGVSSRSESRFVTERGMVLMRIPREMKEAMDAEERAYAQQVRKQHDNVPSLVGPVNSRGISIS